MCFPCTEMMNVKAYLILEISILLTGFGGRHNLHELGVNGSYWGTIYYSWDTILKRTIHLLLSITLSELTWNAHICYT